MLTVIRCSTCNKVLLEANGEVKKICKSCGNVTHVFTSSKGIVDLKTVVK